MSAPAHSQLPWGFSAVKDDPFVLYDALGTKIVVATCDHVPMDEAEANAALIQRATAAHVLLIGKLEAALQALRSYQYGNSATDLAQEVADACELVLAQMGGR